MGPRSAHKKPIACPDGRLGFYSRFLTFYAITGLPAGWNAGASPLSVVAAYGFTTLAHVGAGNRLFLMWHSAVAPPIRAEPVGSLGPTRAQSRNSDASSLCQPQKRTDRKCLSPLSSQPNSCSCLPFGEQEL